MAKTLFLEEQKGYLLCRYTGPFELKPLLEAVKETHAFCSAGGHNRLLVDIRGSRGKIDVMDRFTIGSEVAMFWDPMIHAALLVRPDQTLPDHFWETVVQNRGVPSKVFMDMESALQWLLA